MTCIPVPVLAATHESGFDAVDGSSIGTRVPSMWGAAGAPNDSEEPGHADDHDDWSRYREVGFSGSRHRWGWQRGCSPSAQAALCSDVLSEAAAVPHWYRGVCIIT